MPTPTLRVAFINKSDAPVTIHIVTQDAVESCELLTNTPADQPEKGTQKAHVAGPWDLLVPAGAIMGFKTEKPVDITNPSSAAVTTYYANGKDPWPQPPPSPSAKLDVPDYKVRYANFNMGGSPLSTTPTPVPMTLVPM